MSRLSACALVLLVIGMPAHALAQEPAAPASPMISAVKGTLGMVKGYILKSADKVAEADYAFKPTPEVRSFGQMFGHIANANFMICSRAAGEKSPSAENFEQKTAKADLVKALADSFAYCDGVFGRLTDASGAEMVDFFGGKQPKLAVLAFNNAHNFEHYGNLVTYLRLKGMVPPSSERGGM